MRASSLSMSMVSTAVVVWASSPVWATTIQAQEPEGPARDSVSHTPSSLVPLPVIFHTPETGTAFGAAVGYFWYPPSTGQPTERMQPSSLTVLGVYTTKRQIITSLTTDLSFGVAHRASAVVEHLKFPTTFWGIGNETPDDAEEAYTPRTVQLLGEYLWEMWPGWRLGGTLLLGHREMIEVAPGGQLETGAVLGSEGGWVSGVGLLVSRDTRRNTVYPTSGVWVQLRGQWHTPALGSGFAFASLALDARGYTAIRGEHVIAARVLGHGVTGSPPFDLLPQLGGDVLLRGYYQGRFRDRVLSAAQVEFRSAFVWRVGLIGFAELGRVAPDLGALGLDGFKSSAGAGLRFRLVEATGLSLRVDYGWGLSAGSTGLYISVGEVF